MELRTLKCDVSGCPNSHTEEHFNQGFPGWGHIAGLINDETGADMAHLCPQHMIFIKEFLKGGLDDMG